MNNATESLSQSLEQADIRPLFGALGLDMRVVHQNVLKKRVLVCIRCVQPCKDLVMRRRSLPLRRLLLMTRLWPLLLRTWWRRRQQGRPRRELFAPMMCIRLGVGRLASGGGLASQLALVLEVAALLVCWGNVSNYVQCDGGGSHTWGEVLDVRRLMRLWRRGALLDVGLLMRLWHCGAE
jgi:hypothetical protein